MEHQQDIVLKKINPNELYPLTKLEEIDPEKLRDIIERETIHETDTPIKVIEYKGDYFIYEGNCEAIAACVNKKHSVDIELLDRSGLAFWNNDKNIEEQLAAIGMNAVYDFEAMGGFRYKQYPDGYRG